jgi:hypothetical protein
LGASITGGAFAPCQFGAFGGNYFFGDYASDRLYRAVPNDARNGLAEPPYAFGDAAAGPVDIVFGPDGALYYVAIKTGEVRRVSAPEGRCPSAHVDLAGPEPPAASSKDSRADRRPPKLRLRYRSRQRAGPLELSVRVDEQATVSASATLKLSGRSRYRYRPLHRRLHTGRTVHFRLAPTARAAAALGRISARRRGVARVRIKGVDPAGNVTRSAARILVVAKTPR